MNTICQAYQRYSLKISINCAIPCGSMAETAASGMGRQPSQNQIDCLAAPSVFDHLIVAHPSRGVFQGSELKHGRKSGPTPMSPVSTVEDLRALEQRRTGTASLELRPATKTAQSCETDRNKTTYKRINRHAALTINRNGQSSEKALAKLPSVCKLTLQNITRLTGITFG